MGTGSRRPWSARPRRRRTRGGPAAPGGRGRSGARRWCRPDRGSGFVLSAPFSVLEFPEPLDLPIVFIETATGGLFLEETVEVEQHTSTFSDAQGSALSTVRSARFIADRLTSLESE
ncbi:Scr1 family TA system antitoxin-like transcriptional regulator [Nocardiopsis sp. MG754419]|uniref:Scr1 family TA system antitoxin-like transcriptional regulator n=1 Tax=Nocardiopsis sp. MG754419 TaxID=2259865 RepID=UPI0035AFE7E8